VHETRSEPDVVSCNVPDEWVGAVSAALSATPTSAVMLLPETFDAGVAIYPAELLLVVKELRADGVNAAFLAGKEGKTFRSRYSADGAGVVVGILLNVLGSGIWDAMKTTFRFLRLRVAEQRNSGNTDRTTFRMGISRSADGTDVMWQEMSGPAEAVLAHAEAMTTAYLKKLVESPMDSID
jgi:hypothetical protein